MTDEQFRLLEAHGANGRSSLLQHLARQRAADGDVHLAAAMIDRAFGINPNDPDIGEMRKRLLDQLAVTEHGITFRYIPAGTFLMGSGSGERDEQPVHPVQLSHYWLAETPISWGMYCRLMDWDAPPRGMPNDIGQPKGKPDMALFRLSNLNKIRMQYCEDETVRAVDWHAHAPGQTWKKGTGQVVSSQDLFCKPPRTDPTRTWSYEGKPMVCVGWEEVEALCAILNGKDASPPPTKGLIASIFGKKPEPVSALRYRLPTEAEWEKGARGGLIDCRYPWGDDDPVDGNCDFNRFDQFSIRPSKHFSPNNYGLYAMSGGVWEWTGDWYDAEFYATSAATNPHGPAQGKQKVARGGSWADCAEAVTVSFRMSMGAKEQPHMGNPNIGFRLCRVVDVDPTNVNCG